MMKKMRLEDVTVVKMRLEHHFCITVDHQSLEDKTVTIRHRDTMKQDRVAISDLNALLKITAALRIAAKILFYQGQINKIVSASWRTDPTIGR
jgi:hypothetical protein